MQINYTFRIKLRLHQIAIFYNSIEVNYMLTTFFIVGKLGKKLSATSRKISVERSYKNHQGRFDTDDFICSFWSQQENNFFMKAEEGYYIAARGRLESNPSLQTVLFIEHIEFLGKNDDKGLLIDTKELD